MVLGDRISPVGGLLHRFFLMCFQMLPEAPWFETPLGLKFVKVCAKSGRLAGEFCESTEQMNTQAERSVRGRCDFCKHVMLCNETNKRVHLGCEQPSGASRHSQFVLGPEESFWYTDTDLVIENLRPGVRIVRQARRIPGLRLFRRLTMRSSF